MGTHLYNLCPHLLQKFAVLAPPHKNCEVSGQIVHAPLSRMLKGPFTAQPEERMRRSHEKNHDISVVCVLITNIAQNIVIFHAKLEK